MTAEQVFSAANTAALLGWIVLAVFGPRRWASGLVTGAILPLLFAVLYGGLIGANFGKSEGSFNTLAGVAQLFSNPWLLLAGWVHYLAFDLFIGSWEVRDARSRKIPHWMVIPCLALTFFFGPVGLLLYFLLRVARTRSVLIEA